MRKQMILLWGLIGLLIFSSCASRKNFVYLNDMVMGVDYPFDAKHEAVIHSGDRLGITVSCKNPELAIPFNVQGGNFQIDATGNVKVSEVTSSKGKGYLVDAEGNIDFPILGKMQVEGLKTSDVKKMIEGRIKESGYIKDPLLFVEILNFKYTVLGAVANNGTFTSDGERVTLLEAIANAGDLTSKARIDRVTVIREMGTERKMFVHDLRSTDIFSSPCFYLQQNDVVYVEPKYKKKDVEDRGWQITTFLLSLVTACTSVLWVTKN